MTRRRPTPKDRPRHQGTSDRTRHRLDTVTRGTSLVEYLEGRERVLGRTRCECPSCGHSFAYSDQDR